MGMAHVSIVTPCPVGSGYVGHGELRPRRPSVPVRNIGELTALVHLPFLRGISVKIISRIEFDMLASVYEWIAMVASTGETVHLP